MHIHMPVSNTNAQLQWMELCVWNYTGPLLYIKVNRICNLFSSCLINEYIKAVWVGWVELV